MKTDYVGFRSIENLRKILAEENPKQIILFTGKKSFTTCGADAALKKILVGYKVSKFWDFQLNPKIKDVVRGVSYYRKLNPDLVIAVGGGSVIDTAKSINLLAHQKQKPLVYIKGESKCAIQGKPLIAIPTTAGTGSEATHFAVVYIGKNKYSLESEYLLPTYSIVDPQFTLNLPARTTATTGMDALAQAIESYWSVKSTEESKKYAAHAIKIILKNIVTAVKKPTKASRAEMSKAAHLSGKAINISKTTACHAISYPLTSYFDIPHGHAVAVTLSNILVFNSGVRKSDLLDNRGLEYVRKTLRELISFFDVDNIKQASNSINTLLSEINLEASLSKLGIKNTKDLEIVIRSGFNPKRVRNNPRLLTRNSLRKILKNIF